MNSHASNPKGPARPPTPIVEEDIITISSKSDVYLSIISPKNKYGQRKKTKFKVESAAIKSNSSFFSAGMKFNDMNGHRKDFELRDDNAAAIHIWLVYMQAAFEAESQEQSYRDAEEDLLFRHGAVYMTDNNCIWHVIHLSDKYLLDASILTIFFEKWYKKNIDIKNLGSDLAKQIALPCYMFDYAVGFARVTKWLAYNHAGHITEMLPPGFQWKHMYLAPPDFVRPMNHIRGSLKTCLHKGLWQSVGQLLKRGASRCCCTGWAADAGYYFAALVKTNAYPLEMTFSKNLVHGILHLLEDFNDSHRNTCSDCFTDWNHEVSWASQVTTNYFDGLCIDCMRGSYKRQSADADYWRHFESVNGRWDSNCRITHGQPTFYTSWCGQNSHRQQLLNIDKKLNGNARR